MKLLTRALNILTNPMKHTVSENLDVLRGRNVGQFLWSQLLHLLWQLLPYLLLSFGSIKINFLKARETDLPHPLFLVYLRFLRSRRSMCLHFKLSNILVKVWIKILFHLHHLNNYLLQLLGLLNLPPSCQVYHQRIVLRHRQQIILQELRPVHHLKYLLRHHHLGQTLLVIMVFAVLYSAAIHLVASVVVTSVPPEMVVRAIAVQVISLKAIVTAH
mmetsp:Transcript_19433/g.23324  ORF Transcript_19433/g.23324 Transcript_19433/m.23324 type:complete len:216 (-) Transcript_19433:75-722(-)